MPLQRFDTQPVPRPSGLVPPVADLTGVTELRLHGVGGTTPQDLLGDDAPQQVSGDRIAGFYRTADVAGRHVEAYSWGGLTSRSGFRVLWLLLFPFALANVAGWMCTRRIHRSAWRFRMHRTAVRWAALGVTVNLLLIVSTSAMDLMGYQCGGQPHCADDSWLLRPLRGSLLADYPGRRVLAGALLPAALLVLLAILTLRSISRYESARPPSHVAAPADPPPPATDAESTGTGGPVPQPARSAAQPRTGLGDRSFWDGQRSALHLGCLHIGAGFGFVGLALAHTAHTTGHGAGAPIAAPWLWVTVLVLGCLALLAALALSALDACPARVPGAVLGTGAVAAAGAGWFAAVQPAFAQPYGYLPGMRGTANLTLAAVLGSLLLVLPVALLGGWRRGQFAVLGPFVTLTLSVLSLNVVLLGTTNRVADLLGRVSARSSLPSGPPSRPELYLSPMNAKVVQYLTVLPLALLLIFAVYELVSYWRAGTERETLARIRAWYRENVPRPEGEPLWQQSTIEDERAQRLRVERLWRTMRGAGWDARLARARRFARMPHDVDKLLTAMAAIGVILLVAVQIRYWVFHRLPWGTQWTLTVGSYLATGLPLAVILVLRRGWSNLSSRRRIGIIWDVTTFWPRAYHPLAPPSYAERAVPELQRRLWRIHDDGGRVVVAAHSQGTVLAAAALLQRDSRPTDDTVALVTFGSPLRTLYGWAFPAYFGDEQLRTLIPSGDDRSDSDTALYAWRNFYYLTDYIGGAALAPDPPSDVDVELPDPVTNWYIYGQPPPVAARHSGYWADAAMWQQVDQLAAAVAGAGRLPRPRPAPVSP